MARTGNPRPLPRRPGLFELREPSFGSIFADVDGAQAIAERRRHATRHVASVVALAATDEADPEAVAEVVMMITPPAAAPSTAPRLCGSGGGGERHGAENSCGNKPKSQFT